MKHKVVLESDKVYIAIHDGAEGLDKKLFSKPQLIRRCVIPSTGFYEYAVDSSADAQLSLFPDEERKSSDGANVKY